VGPVDQTALEPPRAWAAAAGHLAAELESDLAAGLGADDAARRLDSIGPNALVEEVLPGPWQIFARQFANTMTAVLAVAGVITAVVGDLEDTVVIGVIVVLNAAVGFVQEYRAEQAMAALKQLATGTARVVRGGRLQEIPAPGLVPGDLVELAAGDVVPADVRLVDVHGLRVDEAALTGESESSAKTAEPLDPGAGALVADRRNMAFKGTSVTYGRARGLVVATGMATELGQIAALLQAHGVEPTPLQRRLAALGRRMAAAAVVVCCLVFATGVARGESTEDMFLTAVSLAVAAIPEGLPAIVTVALALGARRMADRHAVIRRLPAVETLGSVTVICTDKTGTLTENRMVVERVWTAAGSYEVTGAGYTPTGELVGDDPGADVDLAPLLRVAAACTDAVLHPPLAGDGGWTITGDPTEAALVVLAAKLGVDRIEVDRALPRVAEIAFDAGRRRMTTVHRQDGRFWIATKGALGAIAPLLRPEDAEAATAAEVAADALADAGYRVLALAERRADDLTEPLEDLERGLRLLGLVGIADPPRLEVALAVASCRSAGITPVMITGDHPRTARAIALRLGLLAEGDDGAVLSGDDLDGLGPDELRERVARTRVFARTDPEQKLRIVEAWKDHGAVVAMTGDGVNDAPALRRADIGVAMGVTGTDVSKEAADMVLTDDDFTTIVHAVAEGRRIYDSIRRFVRYLLTTNSGEIWVMFLAPLLGLPVPLLPIQILWINLITDGPPAIALGLEPAEPDTMDRPPRHPQESILAGGLWQHAVWVGLLMAAVVLPLQALARAADWPWQTMVFTTLALLQLGHALAVRSERRSTFRLGHRSNPWIGWAVLISAAAQLATVYVPALHDVFGTESLTPAQLAVVLVTSTSAFVAVEVEKAVLRRRRSRDVGPWSGPAPRAHAVPDRGRRR
jgi:Ca2+-transporting ATPase